MRAEGGLASRAHMKLLVVDDDPKTASYLKRGLSEEGFVVDVCHDGHDGLEGALSGQYDLLVLDIMLPVMDGWAVLHELQRYGRGIPVLVLTARDALKDRVMGLSLGADDYLVKPFAFAELLARTKAILRRNGARVGDTLRCADLVLDTQSGRASRGDQDIELTSKELQLLELLLRHRDEVLSRTYIAERVWEMNFDSDSNVIDVNIRRLRSKVDDPFERKLIHTVRGRGYVVR
jgi:two-component system, OmpR family, copper resistance phosphate regulon response regulator CusR